MSETGKDSMRATVGVAIKRKSKNKTGLSDSHNCRGSDITIQCNITGWTNFSHPTERV